MSVQPEYLSRGLAAKRLGISERRLLELAGRGDIAREFIRDPDTGQRTSVFPATSIEAYLAARRRKTEAPVFSPPNSATGHAAVPQAPQPLPLWLTLEQAAEYTGLPAAYLRQRIRGGWLRALNVGRGRKGGQWRVSRKALHAIEGTLQIEGP